VRWEKGELGEVVGVEKEEMEHVQRALLTQRRQNLVPY
jgi:hypothetical protein